MVRAGKVHDARGKAHTLFPSFPVSVTRVLGIACPRTVALQVFELDRDGLPLLVLGLTGPLVPYALIIMFVVYAELYRAENGACVTIKRLQKFLT